MQWRPDCEIHTASTISQDRKKWSEQSSVLRHSLLERCVLSLHVALLPKSCIVNPKLKLQATPPTKSVPILVIDKIRLKNSYPFRLSMPHVAQLLSQELVFHQRLTQLGIDMGGCIPNTDKVAEPCYSMVARRCPSYSPV